METRIKAGEFSSWIEEFTKTMKGTGKGNVPCGDCVACCTSSKFIHIRPTDKSSIKVISGDLMFEAPGLPKGHYLLGYDKKGHCPMFKEGKCSIYEFRPETCRQYDCRAFAAAGVSINGESPEIEKKVHSWVFDYSTPESAKLHEAVTLAGFFLNEYTAKFPKGFVPWSGPQIAVLAVRVHNVFIGLTRATAKENHESIIQTLVEKCSS